ncbi:sigma 54-interacting transcriptional regulator [Acanthopleuribacter pedis]|uniref:Sigma-54-dependent Fis family transcriptional regulator n=1 Tax=Acanthopleuribacter pedis TaxID=442870 RepID=A0A8J7U855_9BACT|nr:sigma-54-dependent Fis family transcriptional regulator [Acanthopleuribacter pedis]
MTRHHSPTLERRNHAVPAPTQQLLIDKVQTLLDSLAMVDPGLLPPSFTQDLVQPLQAQRDQFKQLQDQLAWQAVFAAVCAVADQAGDRHWFFWDAFATQMAEFCNADKVAVFQEHAGTLSKVHPLEAEEDLLTYPLPAFQAPAAQGHQDGQAQCWWLRIPGREAGKAVFLLRFSRVKPMPRINQARLMCIAEAGPLLRTVVRDKLPHLKEPRVTAVKARPVKDTEGSPLLGDHPDFLAAVAQAKQAALSEATVSISGESGTGKELFAHYLHTRSRRNKGPFIPINCSAIPSELIESEMFGHEKGAFTGAYYRKIGKAEQANGGTLFLDEIGEMPLSFQAKLLRFLQEKQFTRVGGNQPVSSDARIVVATHRDIKKMVVEGTFREDLYYRVNVIPLKIPALRHRGSDIRTLSETFFAKYIQKSRASRREVDETVFDVLSRYPFPGNVRELDNIIQRTVVMTQKPLIEVSDLPPEVVENSSDQEQEKPFRHHPFEHFDGLIPTGRDDLRRFKKEVEDVAMSYQRDLDRRFLLALLREHGGSARKAAEAAGINRTLFYKLLKRAGIDISILG